ncbi:ABC transporter ATP-binding protein [Shimia sediminis]|uniref:ABC transporter ATP-binding protein n=1 Tax=Shimia sediminis TaxID=2497945 RepID=UPI000F8F1C35|nr:ABC transporter ATP-binding protein [Shimia sediminis]
MALEFRSVTKTFGGTDQAPAITAIKDISFTVSDGEFVAVVGQSGCGKSTILNMAAGLYAPSQGEVYVSGEKVTKPNSHVGFMLQKDLLLPWRSIEQNVAFGLEARGYSRAECKHKAAEKLEECHLGGFGSYYPYQLSGGMRQRAALARTLAIDPDVILLDEPFSALDAQTKIIIQRNFGETIKENGITTLLITHDLTEAVYMSDRILVLGSRPGEIIEEIVVDLPDRGNPTARRRNPDSQPYIAQLFDLFKLAEAEEIA